MPAPRVIPSVTGQLLGVQGELAFALFEYFPDMTSGVALSCSEMAQAGHTLARLHAFLRGRPGLRDTATEWLALDQRRKRAAFERHVANIESREERDEFDRRTLSLLHRRLELLPRAAVLLAYAALLFVVFALFIRLYEEPRLEREFGTEYRAYAAEVGRWLPRRARRKAG